MSPDGHICYASDLPNDIRLFTQDGRLEVAFSRPIRSYSPPTINEMGLPHVFVSTKSISVFPDGKILHTVLDTTTKPAISYFDIFDQNGKLMLSFDTNQYSLDWEGRIAKIDREGDLYIESWRPFPQIKKYEIKIVER